MAWLQNAYTRRYNVRHRAWGRVFGDRYEAVVLEGEDAFHYQTLMDYLAAGLAAAGLAAGDLAGLNGADARKAVLARLLWRKTIESQEWIAEKLHMSSASNVSQQIRRLEKRERKVKLPDELEKFLRSFETS